MWIITVGECFEGHDRGHVHGELRRIAGLVHCLPTEDDAVTTMVIGTGHRHSQMLSTLSCAFEPHTTMYSPFCGTADVVNEDGTIALSNGTHITEQDYIAPYNCGFLDCWMVLRQFPESTLFIASRELFGALGWVQLYEEAALYEIDPDTRTCWKIGGGKPQSG